MVRQEFWPTILNVFAHTCSVRVREFSVNPKNIVLVHAVRDLQFDKTPQQHKGKQQTMCTMEFWKQHIQLHLHLWEEKYCDAELTKLLGKVWLLLSYCKYFKKHLLHPRLMFYGEEDDKKP